MQNIKHWSWRSRIQQLIQQTKPKVHKLQPAKYCHSTIERKITKTENMRSTWSYAVTWKYNVLMLLPKVHNCSTKILKPGLWIYFSLWWTKTMFRSPQLEQFVHQWTKPSHSDCYYCDWRHTI